MREHEMRLRIESMIRKAAVPAGVGISMALAGCSSDGTSVAIYSAQCPVDYPCPDAAQTPAKDAAPDSPNIAPLYMAQMPDAGTKDSAADANDAGPTDASTIDDIGISQPLYMAVMPDARVGDDAG
jgi:hypothetical protein